jgi:hypothetical protein
MIKTPVVPSTRPAAGAKSLRQIAAALNGARTVAPTTVNCLADILTIICLFYDDAMMAMTNIFLK